MISAVILTALLAPDPQISSLVKKLDAIPQFNQKVIAAAQQFEGKPYLGSTLDTDDNEETCILRLDGFDCVTLVETSIALARLSAAHAETSQSSLKAELTSLRYRAGKLNGYLSRLHYTSDWLADNHKRGALQHLTAGLPGAQKLTLKLSYMSSHPAQYRQLKAHPEWVPQIRVMEQRLNQTPFSYIPKAAFSKAEPKLQTGDIIAFTTTKAGLDTSHLGFVVRDAKGKARLFHASTSGMKVKLDQSIADYLSGQRSISGVMIARPLAPAYRPR